MWINMLQVAAATAGFAAIHSFFASRTVKAAAARAFGERNRNGFYRLFFVAQSFLAFALLAMFGLSLPNEQLYRVEAPLIWLVYGVQALALVYTLAAAHQVGLLRIGGLTNLFRWFGRGEVPPPPEAQGPALDTEVQLRRLGPFAWSRHPLNFAPIVLLWLWPTMTTNLLAFNAMATIYLFVGSWHEEARLRAEYGELYSEYQKSGVPFYFPRPMKRAALQKKSRA